MLPCVFQTGCAIGFALLTIGCRSRSQTPDARRAPAEPPIVFTPIPGEAPPARPCGPQRPGPCLLLGWEHYNWSLGYSHSAWFMDTDGNEYAFIHDNRLNRGRPIDDADPVRRAMLDGLVSDDDFGRIVAASTRLPRRVRAVDLGHALSLLPKSREPLSETLSLESCVDGGGSDINSYFDSAVSIGSAPGLLEEWQCGIFLTRRKPTRAGRELAEWVHQLRGPFGR